MANRPSSRASTTRTSSRASYVEGGALTPHRPPTSSSSTAARLGGLSAKEVDKISSTIASVRKPKNTRAYGRGDAITEEDDEGDVSYRGKARRPGAGNANGSFINGTTFNSAPLNSRLPAFSPRKNAVPLPPSSITSQSGADSDDGFDGEGDADETLLLPKQKSRSKGKAKRPDKEDLSKLDREIQEALIVEDLLFVLMGIEGTYVTFEEDYEPEDTWERLQGARFVVDRNLDASLREVVERILPLATHYTAVLAFTELQNNIEYGLVNHALCAAIRDILHDYLALVSQLEHQFNTSPSFTLQRFWFYVHPTLHSLSLLHSLTSELANLNSPTFPSSSSEDEEDSEMDEGLKAVIAQATGKTSGGRVVGGGGLVKGGEVISVLESVLQRTAGDPAAIALFRPLLLQASQPYARMLLRWVDHGQLDDPHDEFMVKEAKNITRGTLEMDFTDEYWERKYALRSAGFKGTLGDGEERKAWREKGWAGGAVVPESLEAWKSKVLLAGKYVNVMRECGLHVAREEAGAPTSDKDEARLVPIDDDAFYRRIQDAYTLANRSLLRMLLEDQDFPGRLRSLRHHFFLSQGDAFTTFLDSASHELSKRVKSVNVSRLQSQLDLAVRNPASSSSSDPYKEDVKVVLAGTTLTDWLLRVMRVTGALDTPGALGGGGDAGDALDAMGLLDLNAGGKDTPSDRDAGSKKDPFTGMDALQLDYTVRFPISLVISRKTILRYQLIFRHLLHLKHLEQMLVQVWTEHVKLPCWRTRTGDPKFEGWKRRMFALRGKMLAWVQQMYSFASSEVLERQWGMLEAKLGKVETVDGLLRDHVDFLDTCLKECMLTNAKLLKLHQKLGHACFMFAKHQGPFTSFATVYRSALDAADGNPDAVPAATKEKFATMEAGLTKFEHNFHHHSKVHIDMITYVASSENLALLALVVRLASVRS